MKCAFSLVLLDHFSTNKDVMLSAGRRISIYSTFLRQKLLRNPLLQILKQVQDDMVR